MTISAVFVDQALTFPGSAKYILTQKKPLELNTLVQEPTLS